jgi:hypothetical protein
MAYLYDQGYAFPEIKDLQNEINALMKRQLSNLGPSFMIGSDKKHIRQTEASLSAAV